MVVAEASSMHRKELMVISHGGQFDEPETVGKEFKGLELPR